MKGTAVLFLLLLLAGCIDKDATPSGIIRKDTMQRVIWEMVQAEQYAKQYLARDSSHMNLRDSTNKLYQEVFQIHHITKDQFEKSYQYYLGRPDLIKSMFDTIVNRSNSQRVELYRPITPASRPAIPGQKPVLPGQKPGPPGQKPAIPSQKPGLTPQ